MNFLEAGLISENSAPSVTMCLGAPSATGSRERSVQTIILWSILVIRLKTNGCFTVGFYSMLPDMQYYFEKSDWMK